MSRIVIADLPEIQDLNETELQEIYGAGRPVRRKSRESFPGIVHLEVLERREVFSATGLQAVASASTAEGVAAEMQGSKVEKDTAGNTIFTQSEKGSVIRKAVFSPTGQLVSYERVQGDLWVSASYQNGKLSTVTSSKAGVLVVRQEFAADGSVTKETQFDSKGKKALETTITGTARQVTVYLDGNTARVQTWKMNTTQKKDVLTYEEIWSAGKRIGQTQNTDSGELQSKWVTNGEHRFEVTVDKGFRDERTFFKGVQVLHERYSDLKDLSATLAKQMAEQKKAGHTVINPGQTEQAITKLSETPILRESWTETGKRIKVEIWSYETAAIPMNVPGQQLYSMMLIARQTIGTYNPLDNNKQVRENLINGVLRERTSTDTGVLLEEETWDSSAQQLTRKVYGSNWTESYEYTTETTGSGKSKVTKTYVSMSSFRKNGALERREWFDANGITQRYYYTTEKGQLRTTMKETFSGTTHKIVDLKAVGASTITELAYDRLEDNVPLNERLVRTQVYKGETLVEQTSFHSNGKVQTYFCEIDSRTQSATLFNERGEKTELKIFESGKLSSLQTYVLVAGKEQTTSFTVFDANQKRVQQVSWEYRANGDVLKRARDFKNNGTQEIQRREWLNNSAAAYYLWNWDKNGVQTCVVKRLYESGRLISDVEKAPDGTVVKDFAWMWRELPVVTSSGFKEKWFSFQTKQIGRSCYDLKMPAGFGLYSWNDAKEDAGAVVSDAGEWVDGNIIDPVVEAAQKASEEAKKLEETIKKLEKSILSAGTALRDTISVALDSLSKANAALKAIRTSAQSKLSLADLKNNAARKWQTVKGFAADEAKSVGDMIKDIPAEAAAARRALIDNASTSFVSAKKVIDTAKTKTTLNVSDLKSKADNVATVGKQVWDTGKAAVGTVVAVVKGLVAEDLFKIEADSVGKLSFNFATGGYYADFELLKGLKLDSEGFKALMTGDFKLPEIDPMSAVASLSGLKTSVTTNYEQVRQSLYAAKGGPNVYFASKRFTEWAGPGTVTRAVAAALAGDGGIILEEAKSHFSLELEDLVTWLQQRGAKEAPKLAVQILRAIADQKSLQLPELTLEVANVDYTYKYAVDGAAGGAGVAAGVNANTSVTASHFGFAIIWKGLPSGDPLLASINNLQSMKLKGGMDDFNALALKELDKLNIPGSKFLKEILLTGHVGVDSDNALDKTVMTKLSDMLGVDAAALMASYQKGNPIIDLSQNSTIKSKVTSQLGKLAIGNKGSAEVTKLQFNLNTMSFEVEFAVHHKFASGSLADIGKQIASKVS
ncbi:MAG: hypothetical protein U0936_03815 [Planctomycetaceae bacterium]